jgi:hypothetical protein
VGIFSLKIGTNFWGILAGLRRQDIPIGPPSRPEASHLPTQRAPAPAQAPLDPGTYSGRRAKAADGGCVSEVVMVRRLAMHRASVDRGFASG